MAILKRIKLVQFSGSNTGIEYLVNNWLDSTDCEIINISYVIEQDSNTILCFILYREL